MVKVVMRPWVAVRMYIIALAVFWLVLLAGRIVEVTQGERMLVTNPGQPPWDRLGMWEGFEHGPISSKHYAHVTPQWGHFYWQAGRGPFGGFPWGSDRYGYHPEADMHWRRLEAKPSAKPAVPISVEWPENLEPEILTCGAASGTTHVAAISRSGFAGLVPAGVASGDTHVGAVEGVALGGLVDHGPVRAASWAADGSLALIAGETVARCAAETTKSDAWRCRALPGVPPLPSGHDNEEAPVAVFQSPGGQVRVAVALSKTSTTIFELRQSRWEQLSVAYLVNDVAPLVHVTLAADHLFGMTDQGHAYWWAIEGGEPMRIESVTPSVAGFSRTWQSACALPDGQVLRLASRTREMEGSGTVVLPEMLI